MPQSEKNIYLVYGNDEYEIANFLQKHLKKIEDPSLRETNTSQLDGSTFDPFELPSITSAVPFLASKRIVIYRNPLFKLEFPKSDNQKITPSIRKRYKEKQKKFLTLLEQIPLTTDLLLVVSSLLRSKKRQNKEKPHWLVAWAESHGERVIIKKFELPRGTNFRKTIKEMTMKAGGSISDKAVDLLAQLVNGDHRMADQEIKKLVIYVGKNRQIQVEDVLYLTPDASQGNIFNMVDAIGMGNGRQALNLLQKLLEQEEPQIVFYMVVRQFRLILLTREVLDGGGGYNDVVNKLQLWSKAFIANKLIQQARRFSMRELERIYHRLRDLDAAIKLSEVSVGIALETFIVEVTTLRKSYSLRY